MRNYIVTLHDGNSYQELPVKSSSHAAAMEYAEILCVLEPEYVGFHPIGTRKA